MQWLSLLGLFLYAVAFFGLLDFDRRLGMAWLCWRIAHGISEYLKKKPISTSNEIAGEKVQEGS